MMVVQAATAAAIMNGIQVDVLTAPPQLMDPGSPVGKGPHRTKGDFQLRMIHLLNAIGNEPVRYGRGRMR